MHKVCRVCQVEKTLSEFTKCGVKYTNRCLSCTNINSKKYYQENKHIRDKQSKRVKDKVKYIRKIIDEIKSIKGCCICKENDCACLDFHHINSKKETISYLALKRDILAIKNEIIKCVVVCSNCHRKIHRYQLNINNPTIYQDKDFDKLFVKFNNEDSIRKKKPKIIKYCTCGLEALKYSKLCNQCFIKSKSKFIWPSKEELAKMVWLEPTASIAKRYNVSDTSIAKLCKKYQISKPQRGYWAKNKPL